MLRRDLDLESSLYIKRRVIKVDTKFERNCAIAAELLIILRIFAHVLSCCDLTFDPLPLKFYSTSCVVCLNSVQNLNDIEESTAELLTIWHVFAVQF